MPDNLNSFQKWADDYGRAHGFHVEPIANWVTLYDMRAENPQPIECMSAQGVQKACERE